MPSNPISNWRNYAIAERDLRNISNPLVKAQRVQPLLTGRWTRIDGIKAMLVPYTDARAEATIRSLRNSKPGLRAWQWTGGEWRRWEG